MAKIFFNGREIEINNNDILGDVIFGNSPRYKKNAIAFRTKKGLLDLYSSFNDSLDNYEFEVVEFGDDDGKSIFWHSTSHIMAQAILRLYPDAKLAIGPSIEEGFYYDIDMEHALSEKDLEKIESEMKKIIGEKIRPEKKIVEIDKALDIYKKTGNQYKVELIEELKKKGEKVISFYYQKEFYDMCRGPHIPDTSKVKAFKLMKVAGAYWRGDEKNKMLQRIYGISFPKASMLEEYLNLLEEAKKRDHRVLGRELKLFSTFPELSGPGLVLYSPYGAAMKDSLENFLKKEHRRRGYELVATPHIYNSNLWKTSGHYGYYKENMYFFEIDGEEYGVKPMNCPGHILIYNSQIHSYKELPIKYFELGTVYRHEKSGVMHGLLRVRGFTQDDAHIFCLPSQLKEEIIKVMDLADFLMKKFDFEYSLEISTRPEKYIGELSNWEHATQALKDALDEMGLPYDINEGDGAFYGPKIDLKVRDALKRTWQCSTIQVDFALPERFDVNYIDENNNKCRPVMVHRAIVGSLERFIGVLIEHLNGRFPVWMSPVQIRVLSIADRHQEYAEKVYNSLFKLGYRIEKDFRNEKVNYKIREAQNLRIPYMIVIGDKEMENERITIRKRNGENEYGKTLDEFIKIIESEIK